MNTQNEMVTAGHLGGYVKGGDPATFYPDLWRWLAEECDVASMLDVGCGEGHAVNYFANELGLGIFAHGVDGIAQQSCAMTVHDYTKGSLPGALWGPLGTYDLIWCCEFVEHIEEKFVPNFLQTFKQGAVVAMTHADYGQAGHHHVNCRNEAYWKGAMAAIGFTCDRLLTAQARVIAKCNTNPWNHFARSGLVFTRN